jgi:hypothetical protein
MKPLSPLTTDSILDSILSAGFGNSTVVFDWVTGVFD